MNALSAPVFFQPFRKNGATFTDGGLFANYPIHQLIQSNPDIDLEEVLGININRDKKGIKEGIFGGKYTLYDYMLDLLFKFIEKLSGPDAVTLPHEVFVDSSFVPALDMYSIRDREFARTTVADDQLWGGMR